MNAPGDGAGDVTFDIELGILGDEDDRDTCTEFGELDAITKEAFWGATYTWLCKQMRGLARPGTKVMPMDIMIEMIPYDYGDQLYYLMHTNHPICQMLRKIQSHELRAHPLIIDVPGLQGFWGWIDDDVYATVKQLVSILNEMFHPAVTATIETEK